MLMQVSNKKYVYFEIDDEDFDKIKHIRWSVTKSNYISGHDNVSKLTWRLHRFLLGLSHNDSNIVDHINGNTLDNRRSNLRLCNNKQNSQNSKPHKNSSSKYKGVSKLDYGWQVTITCDYRSIHLGTFYDEIEAAEYYDIAATVLFKEFARLNFPEKIEEYRQYKEILIKNRNKTSEYTGVCYHTKNYNWMVRVAINKKCYNLGSFKNELDAAKKYDEFIIANKLDRKLNFENRDNNNT